jgi:hypothetical protein
LPSCAALFSVDIGRLRRFLLVALRRAARGPAAARKVFFRLLPSTCPFSAPRVRAGVTYVAPTALDHSDLNSFLLSHFVEYEEKGIASFGLLSPESVFPNATFEGLSSDEIKKPLTPGAAGCLFFVQRRRCTEAHQGLRASGLHDSLGRIPLKRQRGCAIRGSSTPRQSPSTSLRIPRSRFELD